MGTQAKQKQGQELADAAGGVGWTFTWIDSLAYQIEHQLEELSPRESVVRVKWMRGVATALLKELRAASAAPDLLAALGKCHAHLFTCADRDGALCQEVEAALAKAGE